MDSKHRQARHGHQRQRGQLEQGEAHGLAPDLTLGDLHQEDPLAMNWPMCDPNCGPRNFKRRAECKTSTRTNKRSSRKPSTATSTQNDLSFRNKDAHQDQTRRDSERFSNPRRNKLSLMRLFIQLTLLGSIVHASNYHSNQTVTLDNEHCLLY